MTRRSCRTCGRPAFLASRYCFECGFRAEALRGMVREQSSDLAFEWRVAALLAFAVLGGAGAVRAQQRPPSRDSACAAIVAAAEAAPVDTVVDTLFIWIPRDLANESPDAHALRRAQVYAVRHALPELPVLEAPSESPIVELRDPESAPQFWFARPLVLFQVRDDGRLAGMSLDRRSPWPALDLALLRAILRADSTRAFQSRPPSLRGQAVDLWLPVVGDRMESGEMVPVALFRMPRSRHRGAEVPPRLVRIGHRPRFPPDASTYGIGDEVVVEFVVDTAGRVDPGSVVLIRAGIREFAEESIRVVRSLAFRPATFDGCPVRVRVQTPIRYRVR